MLSINRNVFFFRLRIRLCAAAVLDAVRSSSAPLCQWWTSFWSHTYTDWNQIRSASARGEDLVHGQKLDWKRFVDSRQLDFCKEEIRAVRSHSTLPVTANMMEFFYTFDYFKWAEARDRLQRRQFMHARPFQPVDLPPVHDGRRALH